VLEMCLPILFTGENFRKETAQAKLNGLKELLK
jgi:DNA replication protein DnaC